MAQTSGDATPDRRTVAASPFPGQDLRQVLVGALSAEGHLLTAGEVRVVDAILGLEPGALELYARLTMRQPRVFRVAGLEYAGDVPARVRALAEAGLVHTQVPDDLALPAFPVDLLAAACRRLGLDPRGARAALEGRLRGARWVNEPVLLVGHHALLRRLETLYFQTPHVGRADLVMERLAEGGQRTGPGRWASYAPTGGPGLFRSRGALLQWERARQRDWSRPGEQAAIVARGPGTGALDPFRYALEGHLADLAEYPPEGRIAGLQALVDAAWTGDPAAGGLARGVRIALARALEQTGQARAALDVVVRGQGSGSAEALACARTARRLARALKRPIPPVPELRAPRERTIEVLARSAASGSGPGGARAGAGGRAAAGAPPAGNLESVPGPPEAGAPLARPTWPTSTGGSATIERAVLDWLAALGRLGLHAEQTPWVGLYALVFADLYFLPIPGMLPTAMRTGPLDVGTPGFYARRAALVDERLAAVSQFGTQDYVRRYDGVRLAGLWSPTSAMFLGEHVPGPMAACVLGRLAREGWRAAPGLPDLFVVAGAAVRLELPTPGLDALPAVLPECAFLAEIKGPTDTVRDEQRIWFDALVNAGIRVELWQLRDKSLK